MSLFNDITYSDFSFKHLNSGTDSKSEPIPAHI